MTSAVGCLVLLVLVVVSGVTVATVDPLWHRTMAALVAVTSLWSLVGLLRPGVRRPYANA